MKFLLIFSICLLTILASVNSFKVLMIASMPSHSHFTIAFRIAKELAERGHEVTCINPYPRKTPIKNYRDIPVIEVIVYVEKFKKVLFQMNKQGPIGNQMKVFELGTGVTNITFSHPNVQKLLTSKTEHFDVVLIEHFLNEAYVGFGYHFKAPVIFISPMGNGFNNYIVANPSPSSYIPNVIGSFVNPMSFLERTQNFLLNIFADVMRQVVFLPQQRKIFNDHIKTNLKLDDILYNVSLIFANSHVSVQEAMPRVPNMIEIGGYHLDKPKPLPKEIKDFLDNAKEGVVLFSMGSNLKGKDLSPEVRSAILKSFAKIKQKVLWKFEVDLPEAPPNVKVMSWLPQQDILGHPNVKAFISHGGLLSTIEAVHHGVPIIGIPVFGDQKSNIAMAVNKGYAVSIPLTELTEEKLSWALNEILNNPKYTQNVQMRSKVMKDRPLSPIDTAIYWIEYVVRHQGAPLLRSPALKLAWYQRDMVDIIVALTLVTILLFAIFYWIIKKILGLLFSKKPVVSKGKKYK